MNLTDSLQGAVLASTLSPSWGTLSIYKSNRICYAKWQGNSEVINVSHGNPVYAGYLNSEVWPISNVAAPLFANSTDGGYLYISINGTNGHVDLYGSQKHNWTAGTFSYITKS